jgi:hypothetical protein
LQTLPTTVRMHGHHFTRCSNDTFAEDNTKPKRRGTSISSFIFISLLRNLSAGASSAYASQQHSIRSEVHNHTPEGGRKAN